VNNYEYQDLFYKSSVDKQLSIVSDDGLINITNTELHQESFELTESINSSNDLAFGSCEAAEVKFTVSNVFVSAKDKWLTIKGVLNGNVDTPFLFGRYKVVSDVPTADRRHRTITAYDALYDVLGMDVAPWYNSLVFPLTLKEFRNSFFEYVGVVQEIAELLNDDLLVEKTVDAEELSGKRVINAICEVNGAFGKIGRNGKFQYVILKEMIKGLYPSDTLYPANDLFPKTDKNTSVIKKAYYISANYQDYTVAKIDKIQIRKEENDIGCIYGEGNNAYIVQDNFLLYGKSNQDLINVAKNMYDVIGNIYYMPAEIVAVGNPCLEVGDGIRLSTRQKIIYTYILRRTLKGIQSLRDTYKADGSEFVPRQLNSLPSQVKELKGKTNVLIRTVEETRLEMADIERNLSAQILVNAEGIATKVSKDNIISEINQTAEAITISASKIDLVGLVEADELLAKFATIKYLDTEIAAIDKIVAQKANITELNAVSGRIDYIESAYVTTDVLNANLINVAGAISAVDAKFGSLNADNITSGTLSADRIDVNGLLSSSAFTGNSITVIGVTATTGINTNYINNQRVSWKTATVLSSSGTPMQITYLGN
jgi:hypothetical protein